MPKRCICEICTCGRHRCPHRPTNNIGRGDGPCQLTEYAQVFKPHAIPMRNSFKPANQPLQGGAFQEDTTQRTDYKAFPLEKPFHHQHDQYVRPQGDMENTTSYNKEYTQKHGEPARAIKADHQKPSSARFEGEPTYKSDYRRWETAGRTQPYGTQNAWNPPQEPFQGKTTFQNDFQKYENQPRQSFRPSDAAKMSDTPFQDQTSHREAYIKHAIPKKFQRETEHYKPSGVPFEGKSTQRRDYVGAPGGRMQSFKPDNSALQSEAPFEDGTTFKNDYKRWPMERPFHHNPEQYHKPDGDMDMKTTHNQTYQPLPIDRVVTKRPASSKTNKGTFDGTTNYNQDFRRWEADRVQAKKPADYTPNNAPFEGNPTYRSHYVPHNLAPQRSFRPDNTAMQSDAKFDDQTNYRHDYVPKPILTCEAALIDKPASKFRFSDFDNRGHKFYQPMSESITPLKPISPMQSQQRLAMSVA